MVSTSVAAAAMVSTEELAVGSPAETWVMGGQKVVTIVAYLPGFAKIMQLEMRETRKFHGGPVSWGRNGSFWFLSKCLSEGVMEA
jgi:hypothetical protein